MIDCVLNNAASKSEWISWLIKNKEEAAHSTLEFINTCFLNIPEPKHPRIIQKFRGDKNQVEATIHELVAHELLRRLKLFPEFEPKFNGPSFDKLTPDLSFKIEGKLFLGDVYLTHSPLKTIKDCSDGIGEAWDNLQPSQSRADKIAKVVAEKAERYKPLGLPLVVFVFLGDHRILSARHVETAIFGMTSYEVSLEERFPKSIFRNRVPIGGLLLPDEDGNYLHHNLSAVISCDWFDTLNRHDPGKRLHCLVLHNWNGDALPIEAFSCFPQIIWNQSGQGAWKPERTISENTVAKLKLDGGIECRQYTPDLPW